MHLVALRLLISQPSSAIRAILLLNFTLASSRIHPFHSQGPAASMVDEHVSAGWVKRCLVVKVRTHNVLHIDRDRENTCKRDRAREIKRKRENEQENERESECECEVGSELVESELRPV